VRLGETGVVTCGSRVHTDRVKAEANAVSRINMIRHSNSTETDSSHRPRRL
jgi:hypothetical protein